MKPTFTYLYYLENASISILEIQRTDLPEDADLDKVFHWLIIDKQKLTTDRLQFISMDRSENIEERFFEQGYLKFNATTGTFIEKFNAGQHQLIVNKQEAPALAYYDLIEEYLVVSEHV